MINLDNLGWPGSTPGSDGYCTGDGTVIKPKTSNHPYCKLYPGGSHIDLPAIIHVSNLDSLAASASGTLYLPKI